MHPTVVGSASAAQRHFHPALYSSWKKEKKKRKKHNSLVFLSFPHFLGKDAFCLSLVILSYKTTMGVPTHLRDHRPFQITVHMYRNSPACTVWTSSWFFFLGRKKLFQPKAWRTTADRALARGTLKGKIYKVGQGIRQPFQDFLFVGIRSLTQCASSRNYADSGNRASTCHPL